MPANAKQSAPEDIVRARRRYVEGDKSHDIIADAGISAGTFYKWLAGDVPGMQLTPIQQRRPAVRRQRALKSSRIAIVKSLWRAAEQQAREIEQRLAGHGHPPTDRDRDARLLAMLIKTLKELVAMDESNARNSARPKPDTNDDSDVRDIDEFRRDLARRMDEVIARRANRVPGDAEAR